jgi:DNA mismatch endonuclease (patch repair protein)
MDTITSEQRSKVMSRVRSKDTTLEVKVRSALFRRGLRFRKHYNLPGVPDIVFVRERLAVFIDSCFWHGCPKHLRMPATNSEYWQKKIARNIERDRAYARWYRKSEWRMMRVWEHDLKERFDGCVDRIERTVLSRRRARCSRPEANTRGSQ